MLNHEVKRYEKTLVIHKKFFHTSQDRNQTFHLEEESKGLMTKKMKIFKKNTLGFKNTKKALDISIHAKKPLSKSINLELFPNSINAPRSHLRKEASSPSKKDRKRKFEKQEKFESSSYQEKWENLPVQIRILSIKQNPRNFRINHTAIPKARIHQDKEKIDSKKDEKRPQTNQQKKRDQFQPWGFDEELSYHF